MSCDYHFSKEVPLYGEYDIVVLGGGPSGICAAVQAARDGAKVLLVESSGMLGGMATTGLVGPLMTSYDRTGTRPTVGGLYREIVERLEQYGGVISPEETDAPSIHTSFIGAYHKRVTPFDPFLLQIVLDDMAKESGVEVLLYTRFVDCSLENGKITRAVLLALEGLVTVKAGLFIDCTGNADVAVSAGVPTYKGEETTGVPQPGTLMFSVEGVNDEAYGERPEKPVKAYRMPQEGCYTVNSFHVYNTDATNSKSMTEAHRTARKQVLDAMKILNEKTPGFEKARIRQVASVFGVRESRHIKGDYILSPEDLANGVKFTDRIVCYAFGMDVHGRSDAEKGNFKIPTADVYYIPYRSLVPLGCSNLLVAGKTVSATSQAAGAIRVMPCAMAMGQAAGAAATMALSFDGNVRNIDVSLLQNRLRKAGAILD